MTGTEVLSASTGAVGAGMHGVSCAGMRGCMKADNNDMWVRMSGCVSSVGQVTDIGGGLSGRRNAWRWGNLDVSSTRCNSFDSYKSLVGRGHYWHI